MPQSSFVDIITMGCSKNLVDSECLMQMFAVRGYQVAHNAEQLHGDIVVVNTCGFIQDAKEESIEMILELCEQRRSGAVKQLYVMGCLSERYRKELQAEIPEVDAFFGKFDWKGLAESLPLLSSCPSTALRMLTTPSHYAYLKISEGCDRKCAYCAIPLITHKHVSRPIDEILDEVTHLASLGVKEFQVIAQELTLYGTDLYGRRALPELIDRMASIEGVEWIRMHYAYPNSFPMELLGVMNNHSNVCKYLDIALQHISDRMLERMHRHTSKAETLSLIAELRKQIPGIALRTTLMVGFPGETEADFEELKDFVRQIRFERMGAFAYSEEDGTYAATHYEDDVPPEVKQQRLDELMALQQQISEEICQERVGKTMRVIIDRAEGDYYIGRTEYDSPEVDGEVLIKNEGCQLEIGKFYDAKILEANEFDLYATI